MHDTFLNERIYESLLELCREIKIGKVKKVMITVNMDSHINESTLREHFKDRNNALIGDWTDIAVEKQEVGRLNAVITSVEGETSE